MTENERLEYLRGELRAERISYGELAELQGLRDHIAPGDTELLEAAGVPEFSEETGELTRFALEIKLGNEAMQTLADVAQALPNIAENIAFATDTTGTIRDAYGNTVGSWKAC